MCGLDNEGKLLIMTPSERSFADRHQRGQSMHDAVDGFDPAFDPQDPNLAPSAFQSY